MMRRRPNRVSHTGPLRRSSLCTVPSTSRNMPNACPNYGRPLSTGIGRYTEGESVTIDWLMSACLALVDGKIAQCGQGDEFRGRVDGKFIAITRCESGTGESPISRGAMRRPADDHVAGSNIGARCSIAARTASS